MEWDPGYTLYFRVDPKRGATLDAVTVMDVVLVPDDVLEQQRKVIDKRMVELRAGKCP